MHFLKIFGAIVLLWFVIDILMEAIRYQKAKKLRNELDDDDL